MKSSSSSGPDLHSWCQNTVDNNLRSISEKLQFLDFDLQTLEAGVKTTWGIITHEPSINADDGCFWSFLLRGAVVHGKLVSVSFWRLGHFVESRSTYVMGGDDVLQTARWWIQIRGTLDSLVGVYSIHLVQAHWREFNLNHNDSTIVQHQNEQSVREGWRGSSSEL